MPEPRKLFTAQEFADKAGVSSGTVSKWLRNGIINGQKKSGKWSIDAAELAKVTDKGGKSSTAAKAGPSSSKPQPQINVRSAKSYSIQEFSEMTYLTEFGVRKWLKEGRLEKALDSQGNVRVDGANLEKPHVKRLVR